MNYTVGLIPAHAGKTGSPTQHSASQRAHPRSRGENMRGSGACCTGTGSSPLTRGKRWWSCEGLLAPGLIPAHAGKTIRFRRRAHSPEAHPRSRGENQPSGARFSVVWGSSPLTRGKPSTAQADWGKWGLIPAHAGKTVRT